MGAVSGSAIPWKRILGFFALMTVVYVTLMAPWPGLREAYATVVRGGCQVLMGSFGSQGYAVFGPSPSRDPESMSITLGRKGSRATTSGSIGTRYQAYVPMVLVVAMVLATPLPWRRRALALLWGLILVSLFVAFRIWLQLVVVFETTPGLTLWKLGPSWIWLLSLMDETLGTSTLSTYAIAAFIWLLVTFRSGDWERILGAPSRG